MARKAHAGDDKNIKAVRWEEIINLVENEDIGTQQELLDRLKAKGYDVTQGTVSRDISELHLVKTRKAGGGFRYRANKTETQPAANHFYALFKTAAVKVDSAMNQVIIKTYSGMADAICAAMDSMEWDGVLGTIAGDDTILVVTKSENAAKELKNTLKSI